MKKIALIFWSLISISPAFAQSDSAAAKITPQSFKGYWIQAFGGLSYNNFYDLRKEMNSPYIFDQNYFSFKNQDMSVRYGLGVLFITDGNLLLGASGSMGGMTSQGNNNGEIKLSSSSAMLNIGALAWNNKGCYFYPYLGMGWARYKMDISNTSDSLVAFDLYNPVQIGETRTYTSDYLLCELGLSYKKMIGPALVAGVDAGLFFAPTTGGVWGINDAPIAYRKAPGMNGGYVRLTVGFGKITAN